MGLLVGDSNPAVAVHALPTQEQSWVAYNTYYRRWEFSHHVSMLPTMREPVTAAGGAVPSVGNGAVDAVMEEKQAGGLYRSASDLYATEYGRESLDRLRSAPFQHSRDGNQGVFLAPNGEPAASWSTYRLPAWRQPAGVVLRHELDFIMSPNSSSSSSSVVLDL